MIYGVRYHVTANGSIIKRVECEECDHQYAFLMERTGGGSGLSLFLLERDRARQRAAREAEDVLEHRLRNEVDPVPCPKCGWYQREMVRYVRENAYMRGVVLAWALAACSLLLSGAVGMMIRIGLQFAFPEAAHKVAMAVSSLVILVAFGAALAFTLLRPKLARRYNPNVDVPVEDQIELGRELAITPKMFEKFFGGEKRSRQDAPIRDKDADGWLQ